jgi:transcriptional regulator with PAS, ATPase and Fis domain
MLAQAIHNASERAGAPFLVISVTAIPRELLESELFGYEGDAFTGAGTGGQPGKFELAGRGTLVLDEIGDMPLEMQGKLLRVLQGRTVQRLGSGRDVSQRARVIATTRRDLEQAVKEGKFRLDLHQRLCVVHLRLPALRERTGDVRAIVEDQLTEHARKTGRAVSVAPAVMTALERYPWPGNIRELVNVLEGELSLLAPGGETISRVPRAIVRPLVAPPLTGVAPTEVLPLSELERRACADALVRFGGNVAYAARALGVARGTLYAKMKRYGIPNPETTPPSVTVPRGEPRSH